jgi:hypothetical protein
MSQRNVHKRMAALALAAVLALPFAATAAPAAPPSAHREVRAESLWAQALGWLRNLWGEEGSCVDPNGRCLQATPSRPTVDAGSCVDPDGRCVQVRTIPPRLTADAGSCVDPNGRCN